MNLKPLGDNIVVKPAKAEEQTKSGLIIPETAKEKPNKGEVVAAGDGRWDKDSSKRVPMEIKVGDTVLYKEWGKTSVKIDGEEFFIMAESDVLALVK